MVADGTGRPWGVGFLTWAVDAGAIERVLAHGPSAVMLSFGDPRPFAGLVRAAGTALIVQVTDLEEARQALDAGRTPSATASSTSPVAPGGPRNTSPAPSATPISTAGGAGRRNSPRTPAPGRRTRTRSHGAICPRCRCGPARPSISSMTCRPPPDSSAPWPLRPRTRWPERAGADVREQLPAGVLADGPQRLLVGERDGAADLGGERPVERRDARIPVFAQARTTWRRAPTGSIGARRRLVLRARNSVTVQAAGIAR